MAASDLAMLETVMTSLPQVLQLVQIIGFIFFILFFGGIATRGARVQLSFVPRMFLIFATGSLCLLGAYAFVPFFPQFNTGLFRLFQLAPFIGGAITSVGLFFSLFLLSHGSGHPRSSLHEEIKNIKGILKQNRLMKPIPQSQAKNIAEDKVKGSKALGTKLKDDHYEVYVKRGGGQKKVIVHAYSGLVKDVHIFESRILNIILHPFRLLGILLIVGIFVFAFFNFGGFYDPEKELFDFIGMDKEEFNKLTANLATPKNANAPDTCESILTLAQVFNAQQDTLKTYTDKDLENTIEQESGEQVIQMYAVTYKTRQHVLAFTEKEKLCSATEGQFCQCISISI